MGDKKMNFSVIWKWLKLLRKRGWGDKNDSFFEKSLPRAEKMCVGNGVAALLGFLLVWRDFLMISGG